MTDFDLTSEKLPVVLLPGMDGTGTLFQEFVSILALERPVIVIAYPPDRPLSYTQLTSLVRAQLPTSRFFMLGESFSGPIAIEISASESDRVPGLILVSSFARNPFPKFLAPAAGAVDPRLIPRLAIEFALLGRTGSKQLRDQLRHVIDNVAPATMRLRAKEALTVDIRMRLQTITTPILCLRGLRDRLIPFRCTHEMKQTNPRCEIVSLDAAHMLLETHPAESASLVDTFCSRLESTRR